MLTARGVVLRFFYFIAIFSIFGLSVLMAKITGSGHDFSGSGWSGGEICIVCHTPHNADSTVPNAPLWNHEVTASTFTLYNSPTMDVAPEQPGQNSRLCLSCHDGTVALDSFGGGSGTNFISGPANLTTDLTDDHPISVEFDHSTILGCPSSVCMNCHFVDREVPFYNRKVECASCHEPHNDTAEPNMLRKTMAGSALCLHCHYK